MAAFSEDPPKYAALHWDGKMVRDALGSDPGTMLEALAVLVSGPPAYPEGKLLGVQVIDNTTGAAQAEAFMDLLKVWGLSGVITTLVFHTTSSNVDHIQVLPSFWSNSLIGRCFTWPADTTF